MRTCATLTVVLWMATCAVAQDAGDKPDAVDWDKKYELLLEERPDIRRKVEAGGATKEDVIQWMKKGGDKKSAQDNRYYGAKITVKPPRGFWKEQESRIYSGPQPGEAAPVFRAIGLRGRRKGREFEPLQMAVGKPKVLIFQDNSVVGQKGLLLCGNVFATIAKRAPKGLSVSATFLVDDPTLSEVFEYDFMDEINDVIELSVSLDRRDGPPAYGLNRNVAMTILVVKNGRVLHNFALKQPMLYPDPHVLGAIAEAVEVDAGTLASWFEERSAPNASQEANKEPVEKAGQAEKSKATAIPESSRGR